MVADGGAARARAPHGLRWVPLAIVLLALPWVAGVSFARSLGWDESMHAALPAARLAFAVRGGALVDALEIAVGCQQYPFVFPAWLGAAQAMFGVGEGVMRVASRALWPLALVGVWLVGCRLGGARRGPAWLAGLLALLVAATSPLLLAFAGSLFLEVPSLVVGLFALHAWLRRDAELAGWARARRDLAAGAWIALAVFTKFNYGLLLGAGLTLDLAFQAIGAVRARRVREFAGGAARLALVPLVAFAWWFAWPWPGDLALGASHREAFLAFLGGNVGGTPTPWDRRLWELGTLFSAGPVALALVALGLVAAVPLARERAGRAAWCVLVGTAVPIAAHPFFLDRFLVAVGLAAWPLAGAGLARLVGRALRAPVVAGAAGAAVIGVAVLVGRPLADAWADALGVRSAANAAVLDAYHDERFDLTPDRALLTAGLARAEHDAIVELVAAAAGPSARVGWLGGSSELSPAALHFALLARGGSAQRFRRDAAATRAGGEPDFDVTWRGEDPGWDLESFRAFAERFHVLFTTDPIDLKRRSNRAFIARYRGLLVQELGWAYETLGEARIAPPGVEPYAVKVLACRPRPE